MSENQIKKMTTVAGLLFLLVATYGVFIYTSAYARSVNPGSFSSFNVSGEGKVTVVPDIATVSFGVLTEGGSDVSALQDQNTKKMNALIDFLKKNDVEKEDIKTSGYNISPRYENVNCMYGRACPAPKITGYQVSQSVEVKIRDFDKIGAILGGLTKLGANSVSGVQFTIDDMEAARSEARGLAIKEAQKQAGIVAKTAGFKLGSLLSINEDYQGGPMYYGMGGDMVKAEMSAVAVSAPVIEAGTTDVVVRVNVSYQIR
jgi:uncharacterized protein